jgi:AraC-like DNA-binding protein
MRYLVHKPNAPLNVFVDYLWYLSDFPGHAHERIFPSGTSEMVIDVSGLGNSDHRFPSAVVSGCFSQFFDIDTWMHAGLIGVHFRPGGAARLLGIPANEITNRHISLEDLWGSRAKELHEQLCTAKSLRQRFMILERMLLACAREISIGRNVINMSLTELEQAGMDVGQIAEKAGLSRRHLIRIFTRDVGITPKLYSKVRRFQRSFELMTTKRNKQSWAQLALECGYFDQSHLCRDWVEFTGLSPTAFLTLSATPVKDNHLALPEAFAPTSHILTTL